VDDFGVARRLDIGDDDDLLYSIIGRKRGRKHSSGRHGSLSAKMSLPPKMLGKCAQGGRGSKEEEGDEKGLAPKDAEKMRRRDT